MPEMSTLYARIPQRHHDEIREMAAYEGISVAMATRILLRAALDARARKIANTAGKPA